MALRIPIPAATLTAGLDSLVVFGVVAVAERGRDRRRSSRICSTRTTTPTASRSSARARRPTTPTIAAPATAPTIPATSAASPSKSPARRRSTTTTRCASAPRSACGSIGSLPTFGRVERGLERDDLHMRSMNTALWQVGWGYFLSNMIGTEAGLDAGRPRVGAPALPRSRAQLRTVAGAALRRAAVRPAAGDLARSVAARRRRGRRRRTPGSRACCSSLRDNVWRPARGVGGAHRQPAGPARSRRRSRRRDAHRRGLERVSHAQRVRHATSCSTCIDSSASEHGRTAIRRRPRSCSSSALPWRPRLVADVECRLAAERARAAGAGRRSVAVGEARAELHLRAPRRAAHRAADSRPAGSAGADCTTQPAADAAAPRAAARDRLRRGAAPGRRDRRGPRRRCCATPSSSISSPARRRRMHWQTSARADGWRSPAAGRSASSSKRRPASRRRPSPRSASSARASRI